MHYQSNELAVKEVRTGVMKLQYENLDEVCRPNAFIDNNISSPLI
jgi:hypothetical protein